MFTLSIQTDNAAFQPESTDPRTGKNRRRDKELARILRTFASKLETGTLELWVNDTVNVRDVNGNTVGHAKVSHD